MHTKAIGTQMLLSIIIPVYNLKDYIECCLQSIAVDVDQNAEVICIDDSSNDGSNEICSEFCGKDSRFKVLRHSRNQGLSAARNTGLEAAKGEYIYFLDGDDFLEAGSLGRILSLLNSQTPNIDVLYASCFYYYGPDTSVHKESHLSFETGPMKGSAFYLLMSKHGGFNPMVPCYLFRREFLLQKSLRFVEGLIYEDMEFSPRAVILANRIMACTIPIFNYRQRENSISKTASESHALAAIKIANSLVAFSNQSVENSRIKRLLVDYGRYVLESKIKANYFADKRKLQKAIKVIINAPEYERLPHFLYNSSLITRWAMKNNLGLFLELSHLRNALRRYRGRLIALSGFR